MQISKCGLLALLILGVSQQVLAVRFSTTAGDVCRRLGDLVSVDKYTDSIRALHSRETERDGVRLARGTSAKTLATEEGQIATLYGQHLYFRGEELLYLPRIANFPTEYFQGVILKDGEVVANYLPVTIGSKIFTKKKPFKRGAPYIPPYVKLQNIVREASEFSYFHQWVADQYPVLNSDRYAAIHTNDEYHDRFLAKMKRYISIFGLPFEQTRRPVRIVADLLGEAPLTEGQIKNLQKVLMAHPAVESVITISGNIFTIIETHSSMEWEL